MKSITKLSRNAERRMQYKQLASETDKDHRNAELSNALNTEAERTELSERQYEVVNVEEGTVRLRTRTVRTIAPMSVSSAPGSGNESRAAKRARMKAARNKLVKDVKHPNGECGNVGCISCHGSEKQMRALVQRESAAYKRSPEYLKAQSRERKKRHRANRPSKLTKSYAQAMHEIDAGDPNG